MEKITPILMNSTQHTLAIIKPTAVQEGHVGDIIACIEKAGFQLQAMRLTQLSLEEGKAFYAVHAQRPFYKELYNYMISGKVVVLALQKDNGVADFRELIGATNPAEAAPGTIRKQFGRSIGENAIHGSDSDENAMQEIAFFFAERCCAA